MRKLCDSSQLQVVFPVGLLKSSRGKSALDRKSPAGQIRDLTPQVPDGSAGQTTTVCRITGMGEEWVGPGNHAGSGPDHKTGVLLWSLRAKRHRD